MEKILLISPSTLDKKTWGITIIGMSSLLFVGWLFFFIIPVNNLTAIIIFVSCITLISGLFALDFICTPYKYILTNYELTEKHLNFKTWGDTYFTFPISAIVSVERSYNPLSCPAASLKRLKIRFKEGYKVPNIVPYALASPVCEQEFLETLKKYNPDIYIRVNDKKGWHRIYRIWDWDI